MRRLAFRTWRVVRIGLRTVDHAALISRSESVGTMSGRHARVIGLSRSTTGRASTGDSGPIGPSSSISTTCTFTNRLLAPSGSSMR